MVSQLERVFFGLLFSICTLRAASFSWAALDNQAFAYISPLETYPGFVFDGPVWLAVLLGGLLVLLRAGINPFSRLSVEVTLFLLTSFLSIAWSVAPYKSLFNFINIATFILYAIGAPSILGRATALKLLFSTLVFSILLSVLFVVFGMDIVLMSGAHDGLWRGLFNHKNTFGMVLAVSFILAFFLWPFQSSKSLIRYTFLSLAAYCILMSQAMTSLVALLVSIVFGLMCLIGVSSPHTKMLLNFFLIFVIFASSLLAFYGGEQILLFFGRDLTFSNRSILWETAMPYMAQNPLGTGLGTEGGPLLFDALKGASGLLQGTSIQNAYIKLILELGWVAPVLFFVFVVRHLSSAGAGGNIQAARNALMCFLLLYSLSEVQGAFYPSLPLFVVLLLSERAWKDAHTKIALDMKLNGTM